MFKKYDILVAVCSLIPSLAFGYQQLELTEPVPHQVSQRIGIEPGKGFAHVVVAGTVPSGLNLASWEYRVVELANKSEANDPSSSSDAWSAMNPVITGLTFRATVRVLAGGWYRLECRCHTGEETIATGAVEPIGVGELFLVAGQSYASNCNDETLKVTDPRSRVVALDLAKNTWNVANDPQPVFDGSNGGSIWPPLGDGLAREYRVPVGFVNVAIGGSSSTQWLPDGEMLPRLIDAGLKIGNFRAVLWQQGESDVILNTPSDTYVANIKRIRDAAAKAWGKSPPWLLAKSTIHPTVYNDPSGEERIRSAIDQLTNSSPTAFLAGPDTDALRGENRGDMNSRRHFSAIGQRRAAEMWMAAIRQQLLTTNSSETGLLVGMAEADITPPLNFPMAGYYHERLAEGTIDSLKAKAIVFRNGQTAGALVVCDLIGIATDLSNEIRRRASESTGIPAANIVIAATHSHTAPDYMKELWLYLGKEPQEPLRADYITKLISAPVEAISKAYKEARSFTLSTGVALQQTPVSFNRRFVMRDGSVKTWQSHSNPDVVRAAGPIDPRIELVAMQDRDDGSVLGVLSNFALHLDTVGGMRWSADYPYFIERTLRRGLNRDLISIFGTGCCGDINHIDPATPDRNKVDAIGNAIGNTICQQISNLTPLKDDRLRVLSEIVELPFQEVGQQEVERAVQLVELVKKSGGVEFLDHVTSYKHLILDQFLRKQPFAETSKHVTWGLSRSLAGIGPQLPVTVTVLTVGSEVAIVCLPGEVFVELGLAIKQASPFRTTIIIELSNAVETIYIPHRAAYAGGSYEVTNSALQPGSGEILVEAAIKLLRQSASQKN